MSLLDAPVYDERKERRKTKIVLGSLLGFVVLVVAFWFSAGRPVDWPWHWSYYFQANRTANNFFKALEANDLPKAYGIWQHDANWQQHSQKFEEYPFDRFQKDWAGDSPDNDYGPFHSHRIAGAVYKGNVLMLGIFINDRKSKAVNLIWDPTDHTLGFQRDDLRFLEGPGGIQ